MYSTSDYSTTRVIGKGTRKSQFCPSEIVLIKLYVAWVNVMFTEWQLDERDWEIGIWGQILMKMLKVWESLKWESNIFTRSMNEKK